MVIFHKDSGINNIISNTNLEFMGNTRIKGRSLGDIRQMIFKDIGIAELIQEKNVEKEK